MDPNLAHEIVEWDAINWARALPFWEARLPERLDGLTALEVGARNGGLSLWLALKGAEVTCSYYDEDMSEARARHLRHGVDRLIGYDVVDVTNMPYDGVFDVIVFKSIIGGIGANGASEKQSAAFLQMHKALKPGGMLLMAENVPGSPVHRLARWMKWRGGWRYPTIRELTSMLSPFRSFEYETAGFLSLFGIKEPFRRVLGKIDSRIDRIVPSGARYILFGVATK